MVRFSTALVGDVVPQRRQRGLSERSKIQQQYREALQSAIDAREALVIEIETGDKALTIRNRVKRAAEQLGIDGLAIRRRRDQIVAYQSEKAEG